MTGRGRRTALVALALTVVAVGLALVAGRTEPSAAASAVYSFRTTADTTVDASLPTTPLGTRRQLVADGSPKRAIYLRFDVKGLTQPVLRARLRVHVQDSTDATGPGAGVTNAVRSNAWSEATTTWRRRPAIGARVSRVAGPARRNTWVELDVSAAVKGNGTITLAITQNNPDGVFFDSRESGPALAPRLILATGPRPSATTTTRPPTTRPPTTRPPTTTMPPPTNPGDRVLLAAGDIAGCTWDGDELTARIIDRYPGITVAGLGDMVQVVGAPAEFRDCYEPTWGRFKSRTRPTIGNHEYLTDDGNPYWDYFGAKAGERGKGWYSYDVGATWHVIVLNGNCWKAGGCGPGSPQYEWLRAHLAARTDRPCTLAYWHQPLFSSIEGDPAVRPLWDLLYASGADLVLNGHKHGYERFAPQRPDGTPDSARGIRQITVATGGSPQFFAFGPILPTSRAHATKVHGVLKLTLSTTTYRWEFLPAADTTYTDSGSGSCH